ncbi:MAG: hypothetical protein Q8N69_02685 [bacterium]|nr:hypothetical protein [bacterium]
MENIKKYGGIAAVLMVLLMAAGVYFLWIPKFNEYGEAVKAVKARAGEFDQKTKYLSDIVLRLNALSDYEEELLKINTALPLYDFSEISLLAFIQKASAENGVVLSEIDVVENNSATSKAQNTGASGKGSWKIKELVLNASVSGNYSSFKNFLKAIYLNSRLMEVDSITFESSEKEGYSFDLELNAKHYSWEKAAVPASSSNLNEI